MRFSKLEKCLKLAFNVRCHLVSLLFAGRSIHASCVYQATDESNSLKAVQRVEEVGVTELVKYLLFLADISCNLPDFFVEITN